MKNGFDVEVLDACIQKLGARAISKRVIGSDVIVISTSPRNTWQCPPLEIQPFYDVVAAIRKSAGPAFIIAMGPSSIFNPKGLAKVSELVIIGQPEPFFEKLRAEWETSRYLEMDGEACEKSKVAADFSCINHVAALMSLSTALQFC